MSLVSLLHKNRKFLKRSKNIFLKKSLKIAKKNLRRNFFYDRILDVVKKEEIMCQNQKKKVYS
ncbi:hypothetical protein RV11_GL002010 [Enterococcus phoeniculicola]|nr:hypothetical protein RV11_GL002010 [Enterococcus phoeniculicola]